MSNRIAYPANISGKNPEVLGSNPADLLSKEQYVNAPHTPPNAPSHLPYTQGALTFSFSAPQRVELVSLLEYG